MVKNQNKDWKLNKMIYFTKTKMVYDMELP